MREPKPAASFDLPLYIDPLRLLIGIRQLWWLFLFLPAVLGFIGLVAGRQLLESRYSVTLQLIKTAVPNMVRTSIEGEAYTPRELSDDTLLAATYASEVLTQTARRLDPPRSASSVRSQIEISQGGDTDFFYLTAHSRQSAQDALMMVSTWAEEIIRFTRGLQQQEAGEVAAFIEGQMKAIEQQIAGVESQIINFTVVEKVIDPDKQIGSTLGSIEALLEKLAIATISLQAKEVQIQRYRTELQEQSPVQDEIKRKREELTYLRGRYTDENPLVKEKLYEIEYLEKTLAASADANKNDLQQFTGSALGNNLYLELLQLESEKTELQRQVESLEPLITARRAELAALPAKRLELAKLEQTRSELQVALNLLGSRYKEAAFYMTKAPGYWKIFHKPDLEAVKVTSVQTKMLLLTVAGLGLGLVIAFVGSCIVEFFKKGLWTPLEIAATTRAYPKLFVASGKNQAHSLLERVAAPAPVEKANETAIRKFWLGSLSQQLPPYPATLFIPLGEVHGDHVFLEVLSHVMREDLATPRFCSITLGENGSPVFRAATARKTPGLCLIEADAVPPAAVTREWIQTQCQTAYVFCLARGRPRPSDLQLLKAFDAAYYLLEPTQASRIAIGDASQLCREVLGPLNGVIVIDHQHTKVVPRLINGLESFFLDFWENRKPSTEDEA